MAAHHPPNNGDSYSSPNHPTGPSRLLVGDLHGEHHTNGHVDGGHREDHHHGPIRSISRLWVLLGCEQGDILRAALFALTVGLLALATPITIEAMVNTVAFGITLQPVIVLALVLLFCLSLAAGIRAVQEWIIELLQQRLFLRVLSDFARRLPRIQQEAFDKEPGPHLINRFLEVTSAQKAVSSLLLDGIALVITVGVGMLVLAFYHPLLLAFDFFLIVGIAFLIFVLGRGGVRANVEESHAKYSIVAWLEEVTRVPTVFRSETGIAFVKMRANQLGEEYLAARRHAFQIFFRQILFAFFLQVVTSTFLLGLGGWLVIKGELNLGQLVAAELIVALVVNSVSKLGKYINSWYDIVTAAEKLGQITDLPLERFGGQKLEDRSNGMSLEIAGMILPCGVTWSGRVDAGERVALLLTDCRSTEAFLDIVAGLRKSEPTRLIYDGLPLTELDIPALRDQISLVRQAEIFRGTIAENLRLHRSERSPYDLRAALEVVGLLDVVNQLPNGLNEPLNQAGYPLSYSQALQLTLARALLDRPRLLLIDGTLDGLELTVLNRLAPKLFERTAPWTLLIATHRDEIVHLCDRIIDLRMPLHSMEPTVN